MARLPWHFKGVNKRKTNSNKTAQKQNRTSSIFIATTATTTTHPYRVSSQPFQNHNQQSRSGIRIHLPQKPPRRE